MSEVDCDQCGTIIWTLEQGLEILRNLEKNLKPLKYTSTLGGGVLFKGFSTKDLDIFIAPYNKTDVNHDSLIKILEGLGFIRKKTKEEVHKGFEYAGDSEKIHKHVEIWDFNGKRVDFFFVE